MARVRLAIELYRRTDVAHGHCHPRCARPTATSFRTGILAAGSLLAVGAIAVSGVFTTKTPITVAVSVLSLDAVTLSGSGTVTASGTAERLTAVLTGAGTLQLGYRVHHELLAAAARGRGLGSRVDGS
jgi:hypothetical protein